MRIMFAPIIIVFVFIYFLLAAVVFIIPSAIKETKGVCRKAVDLANKKKEGGSI